MGNLISLAWAAPEVEGISENAGILLEEDWVESFSPRRGRLDESKLMRCEAMLY